MLACIAHFSGGRMQAGAAMAPPRIVLAGVSPSLQGLQWESNSSLKIGRHDSSDIVLQDHSVVRQHAEITYKNAKWTVRDLARNERSPTLLNGRPVGLAECQLRR